MINKKEGLVGRAYGFFQCSASKREIEAELPKLREAARTPSQLELTLIEGMDNVNVDERLDGFAQEEKKDGINYMLQAKGSNLTNKGVANEVADVLNQTYQSNLYKPKESFNGDIVYEENGRYVFRE